MKRIVRLTESDLQKIVKRIIREGRISEMGGMDDTHPRFGNVNFSELSKDEIINLGRDDFEYEEEGSERVSDEDIDDYYYKEPTMSDEEFEMERRKRLRLRNRR